MFEIRYGLGGGFGGAGDWEPCEGVDTLDEAVDCAYEQACQEYDSYEGMHGLGSFDEIQEENPDWDEEEVEEQWRENREGWLDYEAREVG